MMKKSRLIEIINSLPTTRKRAAFFDEQHEACVAAGFDPHQEMHLFYLSLLGEPSATKNEMQNRSTLRDELTWILNSGYDFSHTRFPHEAREFCTEEGNVLDMSEGELSKPQLGLFHAIRKGARRYCHINSIEYPFKPLRAINS